MGSRDFVAASSNRAAVTTLTATYNTSHLQVGLVTVSSLPGAGVYRTILSINSGTAARVAALQLNGDQSGSLCALVGATRVNPSTLMIPVADDRWYLMGASKASGTVVVSFFMYDFLLGTWTEFDSSGTVAQRTVAAVSFNIGANGAGSYWDGRIAAVLHRIPTTAATKVETWRKLNQGRSAWVSLLQRSEMGDDTVGNADYVDLAQGGKITDRCHRTWDFSTGTLPVFDAASNPPGW